MPKRNNIRVHNSDDIQGEGSWVKMKSANWGLSKQFSKTISQLKDDESDEKIHLIEQRIVELFVGWNWVDDDDVPLPSLKDRPDLIDTVLTEDEMTFLVKASGQTTEEKKENLMT
jgi:hypothetical protein